MSSHTPDRDRTRGVISDDIIDELEARSSGDAYVSPFALAVAHCGRGDFERGIDYLEEGVERHDFMTLHMRLIASAFGFHDVPRYRALARDIWPDDRSLVV
jgi:hypothetical protein